MPPPPPPPRRRRLLTRRARNASGTATQCTRGNDSPRRTIWRLSTPRVTTTGGSSASRCARTGAGRLSIERVAPGGALNISGQDRTPPREISVKTAATKDAAAAAPDGEVRPGPGRAAAAPASAPSPRPAAARSRAPRAAPPRRRAADLVHNGRLVESRWVSKPLAFAGQQHPRRLNDPPS
eukprot:SAG25_NODE_191_length_12265_cov_16.310538_17_plen_181_part_00